MIEAKAKVIKLEGKHAWVQVQPPSPCSHCDPQTGCKTVALTRLFHRSGAPFRVLNTLELQVNDGVRVAIPEKLLLQSAIWAYAVPLVLLIIGAVIGECIAPQVFYASVLGGGIGLALGFFVLAIHHHFTNRFEPTIIAKDVQS